MRATFFLTFLNISKKLLCFSSWCVDTEVGVCEIAFHPSVLPLGGTRCSRKPLTGGWASWPVKTQFAFSWKTVNSSQPIYEASLLTAEVEETSLRFPCGERKVCD